MAESKRLGSLRGRRVVRRIKTEGRIFDGEVLRFYYVRNCDQLCSVQIAVIVNKKNGSSVHRNLIKRRIREACRALIGSRSEETDINLHPLSALVVYRGSKRRPTERVSFTGMRNDVVAFRDEIQSSL